MDELWGAVGRGGARWARGRCALIIIVEDAVGGGGEVVKLAGAGGPDESEYGSGGDEQGEGEDEEEDDHGAPGVESLSRQVVKPLSRKLLLVASSGHRVVGAGVWGRLKVLTE